MSLVDLKTNLKSLKYGFDRPNMGSSREPFITSPIPDERLLNTPDFILRDGALMRGAEDALRLTKLFTSFRGIKFITNTNLLAAQNPKIPGGFKNLYVPTNTIAQAGVNAIGGHLNLLGERPYFTGNDYYTEYKNNFSQPEDNRLVILARKKIGFEPVNSSKFSKEIRVNDLNATKYGVAISDDRLILNYMGGPGAGITGLNTIVKRTEFTIGSKGYSGVSISDSSITKPRTETANSKTSLDLANLLGASNYYYSLEEINNKVVPDIKIETDLGIGLDGSQIKLFGPQSNNKTLSTLDGSSQLINDSLSTSKNESNNSKTTLNLTNLLGASNDYFTYSEISGLKVPDPDPEILGVNPDNGAQLTDFGPQSNNKTLSTLDNSSQLVSSSLTTSKTAVGLTSLSHYTKLLGASKVYDEGQGRPDKPFSSPGVDKSGFNEEGQQLKNYGPSDKNRLNDGHGDTYRYEWTPNKRENPDASIYTIGRQGRVDMFPDPNTNKQTFYPNYKIINSPTIGEEDFNTIRNNKDLFNRKNTEDLNLSKFENGKPKVLTQFLKGADGKNPTDNDGNDIALNKGQLFPFILNLINANNPSTNQYLYWQAYVDSFSDSISTTYDSYDYPGYGTSFYKYKSFGRKISLGFTIEIPNPKQMATIYLKLQELIRHLAPNYSQGGFLRGNFIKLTFGDYLRDVPGILNGINLEPVFDAGFDIGRNAKWASRGDTSGYWLPKVIKVTGFDFTILADNNNRIIDGTSTFISNNENPLELPTS